MSPTIHSALSQRLSAVAFDGPWPDHDGLAGTVAVLECTDATTWSALGTAASCGFAPCRSCLASVSVEREWL